MPLENPQDIIKVLESEGVSRERISRLLSNLKKDGVLPSIETTIKELGTLRSIVNNTEGIPPLADLRNELSHKIETVEEFIIRSLLDLVNSKAYMRGFLRKKSLAKGIKEVLDAVVSEIRELETQSLETVRATLTKYAESKGRLKEVADRIAKLRTASDLHLVREIWQLVGAELKSEEVTIAERPPEELLDEILKVLGQLKDLHKELELRGCNYLALTEVVRLKDPMLQWFMEGRFRDPGVLEDLMRSLENIRSSSESLLVISNRLLQLRSTMETLKSEIIGVAKEKATQLIPLISLFGLSAPRLPLTVLGRTDIATLRYEIAKLGNTLEQLKALKGELERFEGEVNIMTDKLSFRSEEELAKSLVETIRALRLSKGLKRTTYTIPGLVDELLTLYPKWRARVLELLEEKGFITRSDLDFVPEMWREWFLDNLISEGLIVESDGVIRSRVAPNRELRRLKFKLEFLKDTFAEMRQAFQAAGISKERIDSLEEELDSLVARYRPGSKEWAEKIERIDKEIDRILAVLQGGSGNEEDEAGGGGTPSGRQVDVDS